jgi:hypothetical protein
MAPLEVRFYLADGSVESFVQRDADAAERFWKDIDPQRLFTHPRLIVADEYSKTVFVPAHISRVDCIRADKDCWDLPADYADIVELSEAEFRQRTHLDEPALMEKREQRRPVGDLFVSFLDLRFVGGLRVFLMVELPVKLPSESHSHMNFLLSKRGIPMRLRNGGTAVLNLANLVRYSVYPGVKQLPADSWHLMRHESGVANAA